MTASEEANLVALPAISFEALHEEETMPRRKPRRAGSSRTADAVAAVRHAIPAHGPLANATDLDVPCHAWASFFLGALERLQRVDPYAAEETSEEFLAFRLGWLARYHVRDVATQKEWMARNFAAMKTRSLKRRGPHTSLRTSPRHVLFLQNQIAKGLIPTTPEAIRLEVEAQQDAAKEARRQYKRLGIPITVDLAEMLRRNEAKRQHNIALAASLPRRKLSYRRALLPFEDWRSSSLRRSREQNHPRVPVSTWGIFLFSHCVLNLTMRSQPASPTAADLRADVARLQVPVYRLGAAVGVHPGRLGMMLRGSIPLSPTMAARIRQALDDMHQTGSQHSPLGRRGA